MEQQHGVLQYWLSTWWICRWQAVHRRPCIPLLAWPTLPRSPIQVQNLFIQVTGSVLIFIYFVTKVSLIRISFAMVCNGNHMLVGTVACDLPTITSIALFRKHQRWIDVFITVESASPAQACKFLQWELSLSPYFGLSILGSYCRVKPGLQLVDMIRSWMLAQSWELELELKLYEATA